MEQVCKDDSVWSQLANRRSLDHPDLILTIGQPRVDLWLERSGLIFLVFICSFFNFCVFYSPHLKYIYIYKIGVQKNEKEESYERERERAEILGPIKQRTMLQWEWVGTRCRSHTFQRPTKCIELDYSCFPHPRP